MAKKKFDHTGIGAGIITMGIGAILAFLPSVAIPVSVGFIGIGLLIMLKEYSKKFVIIPILLIMLCTTTITIWQGFPRNTKQDIRSFLESINPEILHRIDTSRDEIPVLLGSQDQLKLSEFNKRSDFGNYLTVRKGKDGVIVDGRPITNEFRRMGETGYMDRYYFYPKDALAK